MTKRCKNLQSLDRCVILAPAVSLKLQVDKIWFQSTPPWLKVGSRNEWQYLMQDLLEALCDNGTKLKRYNHDDAWGDVVTDAMCTLWVSGCAHLMIHFPLMHNKPPAPLGQWLALHEESLHNLGAVETGQESEQDGFEFQCRIKSQNRRPFTFDKNSLWLLSFWKRKKMCVSNFVWHYVM